MSTPPITTGEVVVVTGASSGVGRAVARAYGRRGARVGLVARDETALQAAADEIVASGGEALPCPGDVADPDTTERAATAVEERWGRIDVWVNCAMATVFAPIADMEPEEYRRVTEVTYLGYVYGTQAALRRMRPRDRGTIVMVGSALAYRSIPLQSAYCAAKHAIVGFTDSLRAELIHDNSNIRVTAPHLPAVNTPQPIRQRNKMDRQCQPVPPLYTPEVIAEQILWAADHAPRELLIGKPSYKAVWAQKFVPGLLDRHLGRNGWDSQLVDKPNAQEDDILFQTMPGDPGAHGPYTDREQGADAAMWLSTHPKIALGAATTLLAGALAGLARLTGTGR